HWAAHKLEYLTEFSLRHGEAVAIGMALDTVYSFQKNFLSKEDMDRILELLKKIGFVIYHPKLAENEKQNLFMGLQEFREHLGGKLTIMLLAGIGFPREVHEIDETTLANAVDYLEQFL
ncbi:3-dehydroquinate synthase, partial [Leptospira sp. 201903074]|nr:3-dehydroquinate synthase [Leptospira abararensis]